MFRKDNDKLDPEMTVVLTVYRSYQVDQVRELLENNGIPSIAMDSEDLGGYLRILGAPAFLGVDILVNRKYEEKAKEIVSVFRVDDEPLISEEELAEEALRAGEAGE